MKDVLNNSQMQNCQTQDQQAQTSTAVPSQLLDILLGPIRWTLLEVGFQFHVFDALRTSVSAETLALHLSFDVTKLSILLDAMVSMDFVEKKNGCYRLNKMMAPYLDSSSVTSMRDTLMHLSKVKHSRSHEIKESLMTGSNKPTSIDFSKPEFWSKAAANLRAFHSSISNHYVVNLLQRFSAYLGKERRVLDLGAGSELLAISLCSRFPGTEVTVFELPPCAALIKARCQQADAKNITVIGGDYNDLDLGLHYDLVWASMSLYYAKDLVSLLTTIRHFLSPGGVFLSFHEGLYAQRTQPTYHVVGRFVPTINGNDVSFNRGVIAKTMIDAGFDRVESESLETPFGLMDLDVAYIDS